jgi:hypothetical protein
MRGLYHCGRVWRGDEPDGLGTQGYLGVDKQHYRQTDRGAEKLLGQLLEQARATRKKS